MAKIVFDFEAMKERVLKKLQINLTSEPKREGSRLYSK